MKLVNQTSEPEYCYDEEKRILLARVALQQYRHLPFKKLRYRNLRKDFYDAGLIPLGYFSYCLSQKAPFREKGTLEETLNVLVDCGDLMGVYTQAMAECTGLKIDSKTTLYVSGDEADANYRAELELKEELGVSYRPPFRPQPQWLLSELRQKPNLKPRPTHDQWLNPRRFWATTSTAEQPHLTV